jgi:hypothetical protein
MAEIHSFMLYEDRLRKSFISSFWSGIREKYDKAVKSGEEVNYIGIYKRYEKRRSIGTEL